MASRALARRRVRRRRRNPGAGAGRVVGAALGAGVVVVATMAGGRVSSGEPRTPLSLAFTVAAGGVLGAIVGGWVAS